LRKGELTETPTKDYVAYFDVPSNLITDLASVFLDRLLECTSRDSVQRSQDGEAKS